LEYAALGQLAVTHGINTASNDSDDDQHPDKIPNERNRLFLSAAGVVWTSAGRPQSSQAD
jgi:hypothetical protein